MKSLSGILRKAVTVTVLGTLCAVGLPTMVAPAATAATASTKTNSAWIPYWNTQTAYNTVMANADLFHTASPFWYRSPNCSSVVGETGAGNQTIINGLKSKGIAVVPTVTSDMDTVQAISCFSDATTRKAHVAKIVAVAKSRNYDGIDFDYEKLAFAGEPVKATAMKNAFTAFIREVCPALNAAGKKCFVTVLSQTGDYRVSNGVNIDGVYDYAALGAVADRFRVMAYDQHWSTSAPGPIAGYQWVDQIAAYTKSRVPANKVELGVPFYGRDWSNKPATTVTGPQAKALAAKYKSTVIYHSAHRESSFNYTVNGVKHTVWYADGRSVVDRYNLARKYGFIGGAYWAPSQEDPTVWSALRQAVIKSVAPTPPVIVQPSATQPTTLPRGYQVVSGDWDGDGRDEAGTFDNGQFVLHTKSGIIKIQHGGIGDKAVVGDWNRDGKDEIGVFRAGDWNLRNTLSPTSDVVKFRYGNSTSVPVVGKWNGKNDGVGVRMGNQFHLRNTITPGRGEIIFNWGNTSMVPVVGDWNADGKDTIGLHRGGDWFLGGPTLTRPETGKVAYRFGNASNIPTAGDWDGNRADSPGAVLNGTLHYRNDLRGGAAQGMTRLLFV